MKIYIASSFTLIPKVEKVAQILEEAGYEIPVKWWSRLDLKKKFSTLTDEEFYNEPENQFAFNRDFEGVKESEFFLFVADDTPRSYNGANVELGIALGDGKLCFSIGNLQKSALYTPVIKCKSIPELLARLKSSSPTRTPTPTAKTGDV